MRHPSKPLLIRLALTTAVALAASLLANCSSLPSIGPANGAGKIAGDAPVLGSEPVAGGIYLSLGATPPLAADELARARLSRAAAFLEVKVKVAPPASQPSTAPSTAPATAPAMAVGSTQPATVASVDGSRYSNEPPPMAVKYYLQGRERFMQGSNTEAIDFLEKALKLDPDAFTVLRLMGRACFAASQLARGSMYLERAQQLHPTDVEANYLLGRYWLERKDADRSIYYLSLADESPERQASSTQTPLSSFFLARALQTGGYHLAAGREYERFLELAALPIAGYRYDRELSYLIDEQWATHLSAAENFVRAGDYAAALPHYRKAAADQPRDAYIASRLVNALAHTGAYDAARASAMSLLIETRGGLEGPAGSDDAIRLLGWAYRVAGLEDKLIPDLKARLRPASAEDPSVVLAIAGTQDYLGKKADAFNTLAEHLAAHPTDMSVLPRLIKRIDSAATFQRAMEASAAAIAANRPMQEDVLKIFLPAATSPAAAAYLQAHTPAPANFAAAYLRALTRQAQDPHAPELESDYRAALALAPDFEPVRDGYIHWLLSREKFPQASAMVRQAVADNQGKPGEDHAWRLLIESEMVQQRLLGAYKLAQDARVKFPADPEFRMQMAAIDRLRGQDAQADAELQSLINDQPKYEPAYRAFIDAIFSPLRQNRGNTDIKLLADTLTKMTREIPNSRFGLISSARFLAGTGSLGQAEGILQRLLGETPDDPEVLIPLAQIRLALERPADAVATLQNPLGEHAHPELVQALAALYRDQQKPAEALSLTKTQMEEHPDVETYLMIYAAHLIDQDKKPEAIALLTDGCRRFPKSEQIALLLAERQVEADDPEGAVLTLQSFMKQNGDTTKRLYLLSNYFADAGNEDASLAALQRVLSIMPDHTSANNDLGYFWVDAGVHLDQAEKMIQRALENRPSDPAFEDSLGWLLYKQGKFPQAVAALEQAVSTPEGGEPVIFQHLGDALFRAGQTREALARWSMARQMLSQVHPMSKEESKLRDYLDKAIADSKAGKSPEVSPIAAPQAKPAEPDRAAGPAATLPSTPPQ